MEKQFKYRMIFAVLFLLFIIPESGLSSSSGRIYLSSDSLSNIVRACSTDTDWRFHPGDSIQWREPNFDDSEWPTCKSFVAFENYKENEKYKYGWYRLNLKVDSSLWNKTIIIKCGIIGACDVYLNGEIAFSKGVVGKSSDDEKAFFTSGSLKSTYLTFGSQENQVLAVRFSAHNEDLIQDSRIAYGFLFIAEELSNAGSDLEKYFKRALKHQMFFTGVSLAFGLLHFLIFIFYKRDKTNLYFSLFTFSCALLTYAPIEMNLVSDFDDFSHMLFLFKISMIGCAVFSIKVMYSIYYRKTTPYFKYIALVGLLAVIFQSYLNVLVIYVIVMILFLELIRIIIKIIYEKRKLAWVIGFGFSMFLLFSGYEMLSEIFGYQYDDILFQPYLIGIMFLMISISLYLAYSIASVSINLEQKLVEVRELSDKTIEQEVTRKVLQKDLEYKESQLKEAARLESAMNELEAAHSQLKMADKRMQAIIDTSPVPLIVSGIKSDTILYANKHLGRLVGYTVEELEGRHSPDFYYNPDDRRIVIEMLERDGFVDNHEVRIKRRDGSIIWCLFSLVITEVSDNKVIIGGLYDISERKKTEEKLKLYGRIFDKTQDGIMVFDTDGKLIFRNPAHQKLSGLQDKDIVGKSVIDLVPEEARQKIRSGLEGKGAFRGEFEWPPVDGQERPIDLLVFTIPDANGEIMYSVGMGRDISDRRAANRAMQAAIDQLQKTNIELKQTQSQLVQSEKMASLGQLVAGVAHEINNPMGAVKSIHDTQVKTFDKLKDILKGNSELEKLNGKNLEKYLKAIDSANSVISKGSNRIIEIVRRLKSFARLDEAELQKADINECIEDTLTLIHHEIKHDVTIHRLWGDLPMIACYPGQLNQVFLNILINAKHALEDSKEKGEINISTSFIDNRVLITIEDNGKGISPKNLERIFDPGFTTKGVGVGTGLGLSICYQIIKDHRGEINVQSKVGFGTIFVINIPSNLEELLGS